MKYQDSLSLKCSSPDCEVENLMVSWIQCKTTIYLFKILSPILYLRNILDNTIYFSVVLLPKLVESAWGWEGQEGRVGEGERGKGERKRNYFLMQLWSKSLPEDGSLSEMWFALSLSFLHKHYLSERVIHYFDACTSCPLTLRLKDRQISACSLISSLSQEWSDAQAKFGSTS